MPGFAQTLSRLFGRRKPTVHIRPEDAVKVAALIQATCDEECTCDDVYRVLDEFAERAGRGEDIGDLMPFLKTHLETCCDCREEAEALLRALGASPA
jgi:hypothetical protein